MDQVERVDKFFADIEQPTCDLICRINNYLDAVHDAIPEDTAVRDQPVLAALLHIILVATLRTQCDLTAIVSLYKQARGKGLTLNEEFADSIAEVLHRIELS